MKEGIFKIQIILFIMYFNNIQYFHLLFSIFPFLCYLPACIFKNKLYMQTQDYV